MSLSRSGFGIYPPPGHEVMGMGTHSKGYGAPRPGQGYSTVHSEFGMSEPRWTSAGMLHQKRYPLRKELFGMSDPYMTSPKQVHGSHSPLTTELFGMGGRDTDEYKGAILDTVPRMRSTLADLSAVIEFVEPESRRRDGRTQIHCLKAALENIEKQQRSATPGEFFWFSEDAWGYINECLDRAREIKDTVGAITTIREEIPVEVIREVEVPVEVRRKGILPLVAIGGGLLLLPMIMKR